MLVLEPQLSTLTMQRVHTVLQCVKHYQNLAAHQMNRLADRLDSIDEKMSMNTSTSSQASTSSVSSFEIQSSADMLIKIPVESTADLRSLEIQLGSDHNKNILVI